MEPSPQPSDHDAELHGTELDAWFEREVRPHEPAMRRMLQDLAGPSDVDDLVQEAFLRLLRVREKAPVYFPRALLLGIARNAALDLYRRKRTAGANVIGDNEWLDVPDGGPSTQEIVSLRQENLILEEAIRDLPGRCRDVLLLRRLEGCSQKEVAARLNISVKTVEAQLTRALKRCAHFMAKHDVVRPHPKGGR